MAARIDMDVERAFEQAADERRDQKGDRQSQRKGQAEAVDQEDGAIASRHGEGAMSKIDEVHQAKRDREPACQHEQQHAIGDAVIQDGQHDCSYAMAIPGRLISYFATAALMGSLMFGKVANSTL